MTPERDQALRTLTEAWLGQRKVAWAGEIAVLRAEVLRSERPGLSTSSPRWVRDRLTSWRACGA